MFARYKDKQSGALKFVTREKLDECSAAVEAQLIG
jgi:hypothetical protein